jgi:hypothetical protein
MTTATINASNVLVGNWSDPVCISGEQGPAGNTNYTWIKYADSVESNGKPTSMYDTPTENTEYIGTAYN